MSDNTSHQAMMFRSLSKKAICQQTVLKSKCKRKEASGRGFLMTTSNGKYQVDQKLTVRIKMSVFVETV